MVQIFLQSVVKMFGILRLTLRLRHGAGHRKESWTVWSSRPCKEPSCNLPSERFDCVSVIAEGVCGGP